MSVSATGLISAIPPVNFLPRIQELAVTFLALSAIQNLPEAEGNPITWIKGAVTAFTWAVNKLGGALPYQQAANKAMKTIGVTSPYVKWGLQAGTVATQFFLEDQACSKATEIYDKCKAKQVDALNDCQKKRIIDISQTDSAKSNDDSLETKIDLISNCDKMNDKQDQERCYRMITDVYNEQTSKKKDFKDPKVTECLKDTTSSGCDLAWWGKTSVCMAERIHSDETITSIIARLIINK